ncbi:hypothetical protein I6N96_16935 [Enterococcus sp. BWM-S5]|uniref:Uncharacterized protein n=1 Tax=Enterococcus larvae TaxID=2794352 RepID=A0ABS4CP70_9ENTE|nr:hypothetical protein [Enterococcus larvae]MBP1047978.1 hypothetical protein [Enterococcus larvae]
MDQEALKNNGLLNPSVEEIKTQSYPDYYDLKEAKRKGMASGEELNSNFQVVHNMYKRILENYLVGILPIVKVDAELKNNSLYFPSVPEEKKDFYQGTSGLNTHYFYLRNNIYVERLSQGNIDTFLEKAEDSNFASDSSLIAIVKKTFLMVIRQKESEIEYASYDRSLKPNALNEAVVLEVAYQNEYDQEGNSLDGETDDKRLTFLSEVFVPNAEKELSENNEGIPVTVLFTENLNIK